MQAINHVATSLILKKKVPSAPLFGLILGTEAIEYLWVGLNLIGVERTVIDKGMESVADIHLAHMPFSHSIATSVGIAALVGLVMLWRNGKAGIAAALAIAAAVLSHIVLDLAVHGHDIALAPWIGGAKFGSGLYANVPLTALILETLWGVACWWIYRGSWTLLAVILGFGAAAVPTYSTMINIGESALAGHGVVFALVILAQMLVTSFLFWRFVGETRAEGPSRSASGAMSKQAGETTPNVTSA